MTKFAHLSPHCDLKVCNFLQTINKTPLLLLYNTSFYNGTSTTTVPNADRKSTASATTTTEHDSASTDGYDAAVTTAAAVDVFKCL